MSAHDSTSRSLALALLHDECLHAGSPDHLTIHHNTDNMHTSPRHFSLMYMIYILLYYGLITSAQCAVRNSRLQTAVGRRAFGDSRRQQRYRRRSGLALDVAPAV